MSNNNALIKFTNNKLAHNERNLILSLIHEIKPRDPKLTVTLDVHKYARYLGVKDNQMNVHRVKQSLKHLNKSFWLPVGKINGQPHDQIVHWFSMVDHDETTDVFTLQFDNRLKPFLLRAKQLMDHHKSIRKRLKKHGG